MSDLSAPISVVPLPPATLALLLAMVRKLAHDMNNAVLATTSLLEMAAMDHPEAEPWLTPLQPYAEKPKHLLSPALRALPTRAAVRPRRLEAWPELVSAEATAVDVRLELPPDLAGPAALAEDEWLQCLDNLVVNALQAHALARRLGRRGPGPAWVAVQRLGPGHWQVADNGPGCADLQAAARGTPRQGDGHLGLGLAVVASHLQRLGGTLLLSQPEAGGLIAQLHWTTT
jgi:C4-dicarboxylate-specific signal transduction histidine kinase